MTGVSKNASITPAADSGVYPRFVAVAYSERYLSSTLAGLMLLSFLMDQVQEQACSAFKAARKAKRIKTSLWAAMLTYLHDVEIPSWETLWAAIAGRGARFTVELVPDTG